MYTINSIEFFSYMISPSKVFSQLLPENIRSILNKAVILNALLVFICSFSGERLPSFILPKKNSFPYP